MIAGLLCAALSFALPVQNESGGQFRGRVVDGSGAAISATVRVVRSDNTVAERLRADKDGAFQTRSLAPGVYSVAALDAGFLRGERRNLVIRPGQSVDLGQITLDISCDAPGVICDYFVEELPDSVKRIVVQAEAMLKIGCAVDLDSKINTHCRDAGAVPSAFDDLHLVKHDSALYLVPVNGAAISAAYDSKFDCSAAAFRKDRLPVVGLGPGVDFCVRTDRGQMAHVFFTADIENESTSVALWYVTRKSR